MRIVVCVRIGRGGELGPFDAAAYETALRQGGEVILLSMCPSSDNDALLRLTRLGASQAVLLSDKAFAGADTLATAYTLSKAIEKLSPDYVFCGRQTLIGDTAQTGPMTAALLGISLVQGVMKIEADGDAFLCSTRTSSDITVKSPALLTFERTCELRLPKLRSRLGTLIKWNASDLNSDPSRIGLVGSPTRVVSSFENQSGKRRCKFIKRSELDSVIKDALKKSSDILTKKESEYKLPSQAVLCVGDAPTDFAKMICDDPCAVYPKDENELVSLINEKKPLAVFFGSDADSKRLAAFSAVKLSLGLCADLTSVEYDGESIYMYRPAFSGTLIAKIKSLTVPTMATVRSSEKESSDMIIAAGYGVKDSLERVKELADFYGASLASSRRMTDSALMLYEKQVGLTGRTVAPAVYLAIGISGAVHHVAGMESSGTVIAINPDKNAQIFEYADYGILEEF